MKLLVDENIGKSIIDYLRAKGHDVLWVKEKQVGMSDWAIIELALRDKRVLLTYDKDFGELVFHKHRKHYGVLLIRITPDLVYLHLRALKNFLSAHSQKEIISHFWDIDDKYL
ncbi:MAG: DUF5615 family PIN-like protein [Candidatus Portnoybacteria bacterium]|nr:DUF5615 family PIN-like protein [Candidatus Portnoybacteria bacterium]